MITIGPYKLEHEALLQDSWAESYRRAAKECVQLSDEQYYAWMRKRIERLLARDPIILVATKSFDEGELAVGWIVAEPVVRLHASVTHYLYVKGNHRREGIATELVRRAYELMPAGYNEQFSTTCHYNLKKLGQPRGVRYLDVQEILRSAV